MALSATHMGFNASDFGFQGLDPRLQLLNRHRVEVLLRELNERVAGLAGKEVFQVHGRIR